MQFIGMYINRHQMHAAFSCTLTLDINLLYYDQIFFFTHLQCFSKFSIEIFLVAIQIKLYFIFSGLLNPLLVDSVSENSKHKTNVSLQMPATSRKLQINMQVINIFIRKMTYAC